MPHVHFLMTIREGKKIATLTDVKRILMLYPSGTIFSIKSDEDVNRKVITEKLFDPVHYYGKDYYRSEINGPAKYNISIEVFNDRNFKSDKCDYFKESKIIEIDPEQEDTYVLVEFEIKFVLAKYKTKINVFIGDDDETRESFFEAIEALPYFSYEDRAKVIERSPKMLENKSNDLPKKPKYNPTRYLTTDILADDIKDHLKNHLSLYFKRGKFFPVSVFATRSRIEIVIYIDQDYSSSYVWDKADQEIDNLIEFERQYYCNVDEVYNSISISISVEH